MPEAADLGGAVAIAKAVKEIADAVKATTEAIKAVQDLLTSERSVVVEVGNATSRTLTLASSNHDHGGFERLPTISIPPMKSDVFGSQSTGLATGTEGSVVYSTDDGTSFTVKWDNPFAGSNSCNAEWNGPNAVNYVAFKVCGSGNHGAQMRYLLVERPVANFELFPAAGNPVLIQSRFGQKGNFELVSPFVGNGLAAFFRDNDVDPQFPWLGPVTFGREPIDAMTMIQSNFGFPGNFEVAARIGNRIVSFFRDGLDWKGPFDIFADAQ